MKIRNYLLCGAAILFTACAPIPNQPMNTPQPADETQPVTQTSGSPAVVDLSKVTPSAVEEGTEQVKPAPGVPDPAAQLVQQIALDLSQRIGVDISQIEAVSVEAVSWPDTALGCPEPNMVYAQVIVDGYRVILKASDQQYEYHSGGEFTTSPSPAPDHPNCPESWARRSQAWHHWAGYFPDLPGIRCPTDW